MFFNILWAKHWIRCETSVTTYNSDRQYRSQSAEQRQRARVCGLRKHRTLACSRRAREQSVTSHKTIIIIIFSFHFVPFVDVCVFVRSCVFRVRQSRTKHMFPERRLIFMLPDRHYFLFFGWVFKWFLCFSFCLHFVSYFSLVLNLKCIAYVCTLCALCGVCRMRCPWHTTASTVIFLPFVHFTRACITPERRSEPLRNIRNFVLFASLLLILRMWV